jgi:XTP/dITP diphosphohydrolase
MAEDQGSYEHLTFVTSNPNKVTEVRQILRGFSIAFEHLDLKYPEIQSNSLRKIASVSARYLHKRLKRPLFIEDSGLFIDALGGFPGPYSSYAQKTIGNSGILKLMSSIQHRNARFESVIAYIGTACDVCFFSGIAEGSISSEAKGVRWGFDPIFIPHGSHQTFSEMGAERKQKVSHRRIAVEKFGVWTTERRDRAVNSFR